MYQKLYKALGLEEIGITDKAVTTILQEFDSKLPHAMLFTIVMSFILLSSKEAENQGTSFENYILGTMDNHSKQTFKVGIRTILEKGCVECSKMKESR